MTLAIRSQSQVWFSYKYGATMRILMISDVYFPRINGVSTSIQTFATEFPEQGHQVTLIAPDYGSVAQQRSWALRKGTSVPAATPRTEHTGGEPESFEIIRIAARRLPLDTEDRLLRMGRIRSLTPRLAVQGYAWSTSKPLLSPITRG